MIDYQLRIAPVMLPHLEGRCLTRKRFPQGASADSFYEKNLPAGAPDWVTTQLVDASDTPISYPLADSSASLVWLANLAALELHTPQWRVQDVRGGPPQPTEAIRLEAADSVRSNRVVLDLDPGPGTTIVDSCRAAMIVATELAQAGLVPFVKTSGNKGLQVFAAIEATAWQAVAAQVRALAVRLATRYPDTFVAVMAKQERPHRIFVDYLQNQAARNTIAPYSLRARPFESVSTPLTWDEVAAVDSPDALQFRADEVLRRVAEHGDLWADLLDPNLAAPLPQLGP